MKTYRKCRRSWLSTALTICLLLGSTAAFAGEADEAATTDTMAELATGIDTVWMLLAAMLVFFMQPGFALVEAGFTRTKNTGNILMKNFVDFMLGSLLFWFIGFGLMFGAGGFVGMPHFFDLSFLDTRLPREGFLISRQSSAPLRPPSYRVPWPNEPSSPCTWSTPSPSAY